MIRNGLVRIVFAGTVGIVLMEVFGAGWLSYAGVGIPLLVGVSLILGFPEVVSRPFVLTLLDVAALVLITVGVGGVDTPLSLLYFVVAFGVVWIRSTTLAALAAASVVAGFLLSALLTGTFDLMDIPLYVAILAAFCAVCWSMAGEVRLMEERGREAVEALEAERAYSGSVSGLALDFGSVLEVLDLGGILGWTARTALDMTGAEYSHVVLLDSNRHSTSTKGDPDVMPTWWHPSVQELVLKASRAGKPLVELERDVHGLRGFAAVPLKVEGSEHNGTLIVGGGDFGEHEVRLLCLISEQVTTSLAGTLEAPGGRDPVSGLPNRVSLYRTLQDELAQSGRVTLVSIHVKGMWDPEHDHHMLAGERLLKGLSEALSERHRAYRYESDKFSILLKGSNTRRAERISAWARDAVHRLAGGTPLGPRVSCSYLISEPDEGAGSLLVRAERALADAKAKDSPGDYSPVIEPGGVEDAHDAIGALLKAASIRDPELAVHLTSVRRLARLVGEETGLDDDEIRLLSAGAVLHDIGKIGVPDNILKKPGRLSDVEFDVIRSHTIMGASVLAQVPGLSGAVPIVRHHHERYDGSGYPDGLKGEDIPLASRIVFVVDAYDSMVKDRSYRRGIPHDEALGEIARNAGTQFDPTVARTFLEMMDYRDDSSDGRGLTAI